MKNLKWYLKWHRPNYPYWMNWTKKCTISISLIRIYKQLDTGLILLTMVRRGNGWHYQLVKVSIEDGMVDNPITPAEINTVPIIIMQKDSGTMLAARLQFKSCVKHQVRFYVIEIFQFFRILRSTSKKFVNKNNITS